jgi:hypothetical protein
MPPRLHGSMPMHIAALAYHSLVCRNAKFTAGGGSLCARLPGPDPGAACDSTQHRYSLTVEGHAFVPLGSPVYARVARAACLRPVAPGQHHAHLDSHCLGRFHALARRPCHTSILGDKPHFGAAGHAGASIPDRQTAGLRSSHEVGFKWGSHALHGTGRGAGLPVHGIQWHRDASPRPRRRARQLHGQRLL